MLPSAVGMAHVLRSGLMMGYTTSYFPLSVLGYRYSEIDQIHLSIEAQCVNTLLPLGDCHKVCDTSTVLVKSFAHFVLLAPCQWGSSLTLTYTN